jgi:DNA-binding CsgD family transcriptional regulator/tetratricopeptide (TPR) repeat protein/transcriptional regulator with XRE-family HTH domain
VDDDSLLGTDRLVQVRTAGQLAGVLRDLRRRDARRRRGREYSYRELAAATGWSHAAIGDYFTGKTVPPTDRFDVLVQTLGVSAAEQRALATARDRVNERQRQSAVPPHVGGIRLGGAALVGRDRELALLRRYVGMSDTRGAAVFVLGEGGIGKTRLAVEAAALAEHAGLVVLRGRATAPVVQFRALSQAILAASRRSGPPRDPKLLPYRAALSRLVPEWRADHPHTVDESPVVLAEAVLRLVVALGPKGCLLILEDLHDADEDTLAIVDYLVDNVGPERLLLIGTARPEHGAATRLIRAAHRRRAAAVIDLIRLDDESVRRMAAGCLGVAPDRLPEALVSHLLATADGVPLHVEELLAAMVVDGTLADGADGWRLTRPIAPHVPVTIATTLAERVDRLRPPGPALLQAGALVGRQFPVSVASAAIGWGEAEVLACLREAVDVQLLTSTADPRTYGFRHTLTAEALRARLLPLEHAELARRVAEAVEAHHIERADGTEQLLAELWCAAGECRRAGEFLAAAGRRAAAEGALSTSISTLERALTHSGDDLLAEVGSLLIDLYAEAGRVAEAYEIATRLGTGAPADQRAAMHGQLGRVATAAGDWQRGLHEVDKARRLLGPTPDPTAAAHLDVVAAQLLFEDPTPNSHAAARELAEQALRVVDPHTQPDLACDAMEITGRIVRLHDLAEADRLYRRGLAIAEAHNLVSRRIRMLYHLGVDDGIQHGDPARLCEALEAANRAGAVLTALDIELELSVVQLCRGEFDLVEHATARCEQTAARLRLSHTRILALGVRVMAAAHHARPSLMEELLNQFHAAGGEDLDFASAVHGFGTAFCHLLNEDAQRARSELHQAVVRESTRPATYVSYVHGPHLLLSVLADQAGHDAYARLSESPHMHARWNHQFLVLTEAFLHARAGHAADADQAVSRFIDLSQRFPLAHHIGLRLIAPTALEGGWGQPVQWLRSAEAYFHPFAPDVAHACRRLLRAAGAPAPQHRKGSDGIPAAARRLGITVREHEVLRLVAEHLTNHDIARRLYLSTRTVEKHIASLLAKTASADRAWLIAIAAELCTVSAR